MDKLEYLEALTAYSKDPTQEVPAILEQFLSVVARSGETLFQWPLLKPLILGKLKQVIEELAKGLASETIPERPNMENVPFDVMHDRILEAIHRFNGAPFTIQRLCELLIDPRRHYKRSDKYLRGLEKNVLVVSTVDPFGRKVVSELGGKHLVNGLDTVASPFCPRDSSITSKLPPVPGWVTTVAVSPQRAPAGEPLGQKETQVTMETDEDGPPATQAVAYDEEEESLGGDDNSASSSSSSSEELSTSDTSDSSDAATMVRASDSRSPWASVGSEGEKKTRLSLAGASQAYNDDAISDKSEALASRAVPDSQAEVSSTHTGQAEQCKQPRTRPNDSDLYSEQQLSLNDSTGFDTVLKSEIIEEQSDSAGGHSPNWSEGGDSSCVALVPESAGSGSVRPKTTGDDTNDVRPEPESGDFDDDRKEPERLDSNNVRLEPESVNSRSVRMETEIVDPNDMKPETESVNTDVKPGHESVDSNDITEPESVDSDVKPAHESVDSNDMKPETDSVDTDVKPDHESVDSNDMKLETESVDSDVKPAHERVDCNVLRSEPESVHSNNIRVRPVSVISNDEKMVPESVDFNDKRMVPKSVDSNDRVEPESVDSNDNVEPESVDSNDKIIESENVGSNNISMELEIVDSSYKRTEPESVDSNYIKPGTENADSNDVKPVTESVDSNDVKLGTENIDSNDEKLETESVDSNDGKPETENVDSNDVKLETESVDSNDVKLEPESVDSNDVKLETERVDSNDVKLETESVDSNDVKPEPESVDSNDVKLEPESVDSNDVKLETESVDSNDVKLETESVDSNDVRTEPESGAADRDLPPASLDNDSAVSKAVHSDQPSSSSVFSSSEVATSSTIDATSESIRPMDSTSESIRPMDSTSESIRPMDSTSECGHKASLENLEDSEKVSPSSPQSSLITSRRNVRAPELSLFLSVADSSFSSDEPQIKRRKLSDGTFPLTSYNSSNAVTTSSSHSKSSSSDFTSTSNVEADTTSDSTSKNTTASLRDQYFEVQESMDVVTCSDDSESNAPAVAQEACDCTQGGLASPPCQLSSSSDSQGFDMSYRISTEDKLMTESVKDETQPQENDEDASLTSQNESFVEPMSDD